MSRMGGYKGGTSATPMRDTARHLRDGVREGVRDMSELQDRVGENSARSRIATARRSFNAALSRQGRLARQIERAFIAHDMQPISTGELRSWCYAGRARAHWQLVNVKRTLRRLNAVRIGRAGRAGIWSLDNQTTALQTDGNRL